MRTILTMLFALAALGAPAGLTPVSAAETKTAVFAGGCFWCVESDFDKVDGVTDTTSGYTGGTVDHPTYRQVSGEKTGHYESERITYDPDVVSYRQLADYFFRHIDPTDPDGQFCDRGPSYRTAIFVDGPEQRAIAEAAKKDAEKALGQTVVTKILDLGTFWPAEDYHQDYYKKSPVRYHYYRAACGRDRRVHELWDGK